MSRQANLKAGLPMPPEELSIQGVLSLTDFILNNCQILYQDKDFKTRFGWREPGAHVSLSVNARIASPEKLLRRRNRGEAGFRPPEGIQAHFVKLAVEEDGTGWEVELAQSAYGFDRVQSEQDIFTRDAWSMLREYYIDQFTPAAPQERRMIRGKLEDLLAFAPLSSLDEKTNT
jgi:hypothetical protein